TLHFVLFLFYCYVDLRDLHSFPTRRSSDLVVAFRGIELDREAADVPPGIGTPHLAGNRRETNQEFGFGASLEQRRLGVLRHLFRSEEHTSELQSRENLVCRLLLEKKKK